MRPPRRTPVMAMAPLAMAGLPRPFPFEAAFFRIVIDGTEK